MLINQRWNVEIQRADLTVSGDLGPSKCGCVTTTALGSSSTTPVRHWGAPSSRRQPMMSAVSLL
jgi:hypothetical protein